MTAARYRTLRLLLGTQGDVAAMLGLHRVTIAKREAGTIPITTEAALAITAIRQQSAARRRMSGPAGYDGSSVRRAKKTLNEWASRVSETTMNERPKLTHDMSAPETYDSKTDATRAHGAGWSARLGADCGALTPDSPVPRLRKYAGRKMSEVPKWFWQFMWDKAGYGGFGQRRGWQGRVADYLETHCGFWQEPRPEWAYEAPNDPSSPRAGAPGASDLPEANRASGSSAAHEAAVPCRPVPHHPRRHHKERRPCG